MSTIDRPQADTSPADATGTDLPDGPPSAALIAAGAGCLTMGAFTTAAEANASFAKTITYSNAVGPLSGKTILTVIIWLAIWVVLHVALRHRQVGIARALFLSLILTAGGVLLTFPTFFQMFE